MAWSWKELHRELCLSAPSLWSTWSFPGPTPLARACLWAWEQVQVSVRPEALAAWPPCVPPWGEP